VIYNGLDIEVHDLRPAIYTTTTTTTTSVFTCEDTFFIPRLQGHSYPDIDQLQLNQEGVVKLYLAY